MKKTLALILVTLLTFSMMLTGCSPKATSDKAAEKKAVKEPQELTINLFQEVGTLDWQASSSSNEMNIYSFVMENLTRSVGQGKVAPGIAERWDISADGKVWTFHLRDAKWQDGKPVTAGDFKYGWLRALDPKTPRDYAYFLYDILNAEEYNNGKATADQVGVKVVDDKTLEVTLKQPVTYFDFLVTFVTYAPARKDIIEKFGDKYNREAENFIVDGPFKIEKWEHESEMVFVKNPTYWNAKEVKLEKVTGLMIADDSTEFNMYEAGAIDHTLQLTAEQKASLKRGTAKTYAEGHVRYFSYNNTDPVLKNANIRKALTYAIDRKNFIDNVAKQPWKPAMAFVQPDIIPDFDGSQFRDKVPTFFKDNDIETAKTLLEKGMKELNITKIPTLKLLCNDNSATQMYAQAFQEMFKKNLSVNIEIEPVPSSVRIERQHKHDFQISLAGWGPDYPDPMTDLDLFVTGSGNNDCQYSNPAYDALIKAAKAEVDKQKKFEMMHNAEAMIMADMPIGPIYYEYRDYAVSDYLKNFQRDCFNDMPIVNAYIEGKTKQ